MVKSRRKFLCDRPLSKKTKKGGSKMDVQNFFGSGRHSHIGSIVREFTVGQVAGTLLSAIMPAGDLSPERISAVLFIAPAAVGFGASQPVREYVTRHPDYWPLLAGIAAGIATGLAAKYVAKAHTDKPASYSMPVFMSGGNTYRV